MKLTYVGRYDKVEQVLRLCRIVGARGVVGDGQGYSWKLSLGLKASFCNPLRVRWQKSYGGCYV